MEWRQNCSMPVGEEMDHDAEENEYEDRDSAQVERLLTEMVQHGLLCIVFCKTRKWCEHVLAQDGSLAPPPQLRYLASELRQIVADLFGGRLRGVEETNVQEMSIDIGHIDDMLHLSFLGSTTTIWQQGGLAIEVLCGRLYRLRRCPRPVLHELPRQALWKALKMCLALRIST